MLAEQLGPRIKACRIQRSLTQSELARAAKVSRTVLSRLEQGKPMPVQTDVLDRLFHALGIDPKFVDGAAPGDERRLARLEHQRVLEVRRSRHLRLALRLAGGGQEASMMIRKAREQVEMWRRNRLCSAFYVERWTQLLQLPPKKLATSMAGFGEWEDALFQNSPWPGHGTQ